MRFQDITGHAKAKESLCRLVDSGKVPHALMISGPSGIGKLRLARAFAQYIHCPHRSGGDSCGVCPTCRQHEALNFPDAHYIYPVVKRDSRRISDDYAQEWREFAADSEFALLRDWMEKLEAGNTAPTIYVDESQEIVRVAALSNYSASQKIFIVWLPEAMQPATANKLLKVLEEPFPDTVFILVSDNPTSVLPTILSRMRRIELRRLDEAEITEWLQLRFGVEYGKALEIARLSEGIPARARQLIDNDEENALWGETFRSMMRLAYGCKIVELKALADEMAAYGRQKLQRLFDYCQRQLRENFIYNIGDRQLNLLSSEEEQFSVRFAPFIHSGNVERIMKELDGAASDIARNANAKIVCFDMLLQLVRLIRMPKS